MGAGQGGVTRTWTERGPGGCITITRLEGTGMAGESSGSEDTTIERLLAKVEGRIAPDLTDIQRLATIIRRQQAQIAALEAARPAHGLPLEGTGPLPLERKEAP